MSRRPQSSSHESQERTPRQEDQDMVLFAASRFRQIIDDFDSDKPNKIAELVWALPIASGHSYPYRSPDGRVQNRMFSVPVNLESYWVDILRGMDLLNDWISVLRKLSHICLKEWFLPLPARLHLHAFLKQWTSPTHKYPNGVLHTSDIFIHPLTQDEIHNLTELTLSYTDLTKISA